jgi:hypothetical protein
MARTRCVAGKDMAGKASRHESGHGLFLGPSTGLLLTCRMLQQLHRFRLMGRQPPLPGWPRYLGRGWCCRGSRPPKKSFFQGLWRCCDSTTQGG